MKKLINSKLKGGALFTALFVNVMVLILLSITILYAYYTNYSTHLLNKQTHVLNYYQSVINYIEYSDDQISYNTPINLFNDRFSAQLSTQKWGGYEIMKISILEENSTIAERTALFGNVVEKLPALHVTDRNEPIAFAGNTVLTGDCILPEKGTRPSSLSTKQGIPNTKSARLIRKYSQIPPIHFSIPSFSDYNGTYGSTEQLEKKQIAQSFLQPPLKFQQAELLQLQNKELSGHIVFSSSTGVELNNITAHNIIVIAPYIKVTNTTGAIQLFATDSIIVGQQSKLTYPSFLLLENEAPTTRKIDIQSGTTIVGAVVLNAHRQREGSELKLRGTLDGIVYTNGNLNLSANIYGSVFANSLLYREATGSSYRNLIFNTQISNTQLPWAKFASPKIFESPKKRRIQWLNIK